MKQKQFLECPVILSLSSRWHCCIKTTHQLRFRDWRKIFFSLSKNLPSSNGQTGKKWIMKRLFPSLVQYGWCSWENGFPYLNMCVFDHFIHGICWVWKVTPSFLPPSLPPSLSSFLILSPCPSLTNIFGLKKERWETWAEWEADMFWGCCCCFPQLVYV